MGKKPVISRKEYLDERLFYIKSEQKVMEIFDKNLTYLSAGAIGLSITIICSFKDKVINEKYILNYSWTLFVIVLIASLVLHLMSYKAFKKRIVLWDRYYRGEKDVFDKPDCLSCWIDALNMLSLVLFIVGVVLLLIFCFKQI